jgi:hypothetical protein
VFGPRHKRILTTQSIYSEDQVAVVGNLRMDLFGPVDQGAESSPAPYEFGAPGDIRLLYSCNYPRDEEFLDLVAQLAVSRMPVFLIIKMHPHGGDSPEVYEAICRASGFDRFRIVTEEYDLYRLLRSVDIHIAYSSTVLTEATLLRVPNITLAAGGFIGDPQHISVNLRDFASLDEAMVAARRLPARADAYEAFAAAYAYRLDGQAGNRAAEIILRDIGIAPARA